MECRHRELTTQHKKALQQGKEFGNDSELTKKKALTAQERKAKQREKQRENDLDAFRKKEREERKRSRQNKKNILTDQDLQATRMKECIRKQVYRYKKKHQNPLNIGPEEILKTKVPRTKEYTIRRSLQKAHKSLPQNFSLRVHVVKRLADECIPSLLKPLSAKSDGLQAHALSETVISIVQDYYRNTMVAYEAPGKKDMIILRKPGEDKQKVQKKFLTLTLKETHQLFLGDHPDVKISFSYFCKLRPVDVVLRHQTPKSMCLCEYHENMNLLLAKVSDLPSFTSDFIRLIVCDDSSKQCMMQFCEECKGLKKFHQLTHEMLSVGGTETPGSSSADKRSTQITFEQWTKEKCSDHDSTERLCKRQYTDTLSSVIACIETQLEYFLFHAFIKRQQAMWFENQKLYIKVGQLLVMMDFSENFTHVSQDEIQGAFFDQTSSTLFTIMLYYCEDGKVKSESFVIISDFKGYNNSKGHDKYAVSHFTKVVVEQFEARHPNYNLTKIMFQSDGTGQHFKQRFSLCQVLTLNFPSYDVEWHFSATSHGKGPIDGLGGTIKRRVTEHVLGQRESIINTANFFKLACDTCPNINITYVPSAETISFIKSEKLEDNWKDIKSIPATQKQHFFKKVDKYIIEYSSYSTDNERMTFDMLKPTARRIMNGESTPRKVGRPKKKGFPGM